MTPEGERPDGAAELTVEEWRKAMLFESSERTALSNERTFLAWVRTSLALITLGFVVQRFELLVLPSQSSPRPASLVTWVPVLFFVLGGLIIALGTWQFFRVRRGLRRRVLRGRNALRDALIVTTLVFVLIVSAIFVLSAL